MSVPSEKNSTMGAGENGDRELLSDAFARPRHEQNGSLDPSRQVEEG